MFVLSENMKNNIAKKVGLSLNDILSMSANAISRHLEKKLHKQLTTGYPNDRLAARGSVYIDRKRLITPEETEKKISQI